MAEQQIAIVNIDWADSKIGEELKGFYGPFASTDEAWEWGLATIRNGEWEVITPQSPADVEVGGQER